LARKVAIFRWIERYIIRQTLRVCPECKKVGQLSLQNEPIQAQNQLLDTAIEADYYCRYCEKSIDVDKPV
jgi:hypothetical protein